MVRKKMAPVRLGGLALAVILLGACASQGPVVQLQGDLTGIETVAILPYENMSALYGAGESVRCPITGLVFVTGPVIDRADQFLTAQVISHLQRDTAFDIVPSRDAADILTNLQAGVGHDWSRPKLLARTGQRLGADAIMVGHVYRFRERSGGSAASESPASVAFDLYLIDCRRERVLWSAFYDYTQEPLTENLGAIGNFFRRGGRWVTAEELATTALKDIFQNFPQP
jgi:hypothetical protein